MDAQDREPVLGFMACLPDMQWEQVRARTDDWVAKAVSYVDTAWVERKDILQAFASTASLAPLPNLQTHQRAHATLAGDHTLLWWCCVQWPEGQEEMCEVAFHHYEVQRSEDGGVSTPAVELDGELTERYAPPCSSLALSGTCDVVHRLATVLWVDD